MPIRDTRMMARAVEQRWPIKPEIRGAIVRRLLRVIADPQSTPREVTAASRAILAAEAQNQSDEHKLIDASIQRRDNELAAIAADLGIEARLVIDAERTSSVGDSGTNAAVAQAAVR